MRRRITTDEEKVVNAITKLIGHLTIDLDRVGIYLARIAPTVIYNRFMMIAEAAQAEKEEELSNERQDTIYY
jgi:phosphoribosyl-ATP pyrophosphohydrolase